MHMIEASYFYTIIFLVFPTSLPQSTKIAQTFTLYRLIKLTADSGHTNIIF